MQQRVSTLSRKKSKNLLKKTRSNSHDSEEVTSHTTAPRTIGFSILGNLNQAIDYLYSNHTTFNVESFQTSLESVSKTQFEKAFHYSLQDGVGTLPFSWWSKFSVNPSIIIYWVKYILLGAVGTINSSNLQEHYKKNISIHWVVASKDETIDPQTIDIPKRHYKTLEEIIQTEKQGVLGPEDVYSKFVKQMFYISTNEKNQQSKTQSLFPRSIVEKLITYTDQLWEIDETSQIFSEIFSVNDSTACLLHPSEMQFFMKFCCYFHIFNAPHRFSGKMIIANLFVDCIFSPLPFSSTNYTNDRKTRMEILNFVINNASFIFPAALKSLKTEFPDGHSSLFSDKIDRSLGLDGMLHLLDSEVSSIYSILSSFSAIETELSSLYDQLLSQQEIDCAQLWVSTSSTISSNIDRSNSEIEKLPSILDLSVEARNLLRDQPNLLHSSSRSQFIKDILEIRQSQSQRKQSYLLQAIRFGSFGSESDFVSPSSRRSSRSSRSSISLSSAGMLSATSTSSSSGTSKREQREEVFDIILNYISECLFFNEKKYSETTDITDEDCFTHFGNNSELDKMDFFVTSIQFPFLCDAIYAIELELDFGFFYAEILRLYKKILTTANISNVTNLKILTDTDKYKKFIGQSEVDPMVLEEIFADMDITYQVSQIEGKIYDLESYNKLMSCMDKIEAFASLLVIVNSKLLSPSTQPSNNNNNMSNNVIMNNSGSGNSNCNISNSGGNRPSLKRDWVSSVAPRSQSKSNYLRRSSSLTEKKEINTNNDNHTSTMNNENDDHIQNHLLNNGDNGLSEHHNNNSNINNDNDNDNENDNGEEDDEYTDDNNTSLETNDRGDDEESGNYHKEKVSNGGDIGMVVFGVLLKKMNLWDVWKPFYYYYSPSTNTLIEHSFNLNASLNSVENYIMEKYDHHRKTYDNDSSGNNHLENHNDEDGDNHDVHHDVVETQNINLDKYYIINVSSLVGKDFSYLFNHKENNSSFVLRVENSELISSWSPVMDTTQMNALHVRMFKEPVAVVSQIGKVVDVNSALEVLLGYLKEELFRKSVKILFSKFDANFFEENIRNASKSNLGILFQTKLQRKDDKIIKVNVLFGEHYWKAKKFFLLSFSDLE